MGAMALGEEGGSKGSNDSNQVKMTSEYAL